MTYDQKKIFKKFEFIQNFGLFGLPNLTFDQHDYCVNNRTCIKTLIVIG